VVKHAFSGFLRNFGGFRGKQTHPRKSEKIRVICVPFFLSQMQEWGIPEINIRELVARNLCGLCETFADSLR
jgi:hypothetical protein